MSWVKFTRSDVGANEKKRFIREAFDKWVDWEKETKNLYQESYCELCELGEVAANFADYHRHSVGGKSDVVACIEVINSFHKPYATYLEKVVEIFTAVCKTLNNA